MRIKSGLVILIMLSINTISLYSQNRTDFNNLVPGKTYKIVLFDDTEIFGKVISIDTAEVIVETKNHTETIAPVNTILYYSTDLTPSKYNYSFSLLGGTSFFPDENGYNVYNDGSTTGLNFNLGFTYYISDGKAIKIDAGYTYFKPKYAGIIGEFSVENDVYDFVNINPQAKSNRLRSIMLKHKK